VTLDGDTTLSFKIHIVQQLSLHFSSCHGASKFQQPVSQGAFSVINMGYNTKVTNIFHKKLFSPNNEIEVQK
jgi:hypothetical protein